MPSAAIAVIAPARNEGEQIADTLRALATQVLQPTRIVVVANNCTDDTVPEARKAARELWHATGVRVDVLEMQWNTGKKAGALNYGLAYLRESSPTLSHLYDLVVTMDADTALDPTFLRRAAQIMGEDDTLGGVSAACRGKAGIGASPWQRTLALFQYIEYGRYAFTRVRSNVHTMSGAGSVYRAEALDQQRASHGYYFDTFSLVEDYALTLDLKADGWAVTTNSYLVAHTDLMPTMSMLLAQRVRWVMGTVTELRKRGWTRHTAPSILTLALGFAGILYTAIWLAITVGTVQRNGMHIEPQYIAWMGFWMVYQIYSVKHMGWRVVLFEALLVPELLFGFVRNYWLVKSVGLSYYRSVAALTRKAFNSTPVTVEEVWH